MYYVYILRCSDNSLYCGQTKDLVKRIKDHNSSKAKSSKYTWSRRPVKLEYSEKFPTLEKALKREWQIKKLIKSQKETLIRGEKCYLNKCT